MGASESAPARRKEEKKTKIHGAGKKFGQSSGLFINWH